MSKAGGKGKAQKKTLRGKKELTPEQRKEVLEAFSVNFSARS